MKVWAGFSFLGCCLYEAMPVVAVCNHEKTANSLQRTQHRTLIQNPPQKESISDFLRIGNTISFLVELFNLGVTAKHHKRERRTTWNWVRILHTVFLASPHGHWLGAEVRGQAALGVKGSLPATLAIEKPQPRPKTQVLTFQPQKRERDFK